MPDLHHVRAVCRDYPVPLEQIAAVERVAVQRHATTLKCRKKGKNYSVILFLCETPERAERLQADLLAHAPVVTCERPRSPVSYDYTPYLFPVGTRVRAKEDLLNLDDPEEGVIVAAGTLGTVIGHHDEHSFVCRFDHDPERLAVACDFELAEAGPPCIFCDRGAHYDLGFPGLFVVSCCCDHLANAKAALGPEAVCKDRDL